MKTRSMRAALSLVSVSILATTSVEGSALAGPKAVSNVIAGPKTLAAREQQKRGNALYRTREFAAALDAYKQGLALENAPVFAYNLGQCYRQLGQYAAAIWHFERFLGSTPSPELAAIVQRLIAEMTSELQQHARSSPPTEPGGDDSVQGDKNAPPIAATASPKVADMGESQHWYHDGLGWGLSATGVVVGASALWLALDARRLDMDASREATQARREELRDTAQDRRLAGAIIGVTGGMLLVAGVAKLAITDGQTRLRVAGSPAGLHFFGRF